MKWKHVGRFLAETAGSLARAFGTVVVWCIVGIFAVVTIVSILWKMEDTPVRGLEGAAASLPSVVFIDMLGMEVRQLPQDANSSSFSSEKVTGFLTRLATGVDIGDPRTLAAQVLPGAPNNEYVILVRGKDTEAHEFPLEIPPSPDLGLHEEPAEDGNSGQDPAQPNDGTPGTPEADPEPNTPPAADLSKKIAFVYHTHNTESYLPELDGETKPDRAYSLKDSSITVTAVGKHLVERLADKGIGALHNESAYSWKTAYTQSRKTVKAVMQKNAELQFILDLHRDSARREKTTLTKDGKTYAKLWFVIGKRNPEFEKNFKFAEEISRRVDEKIPGLSKGVVGKLEGSNGEFNQSLSPQSVLVEVGGVDNSLEEAKRSMEILAEALAEMYWDSEETEEASAPVASAQEAESQKNQ
ncbi:stage II sporulation protein P [Paenibacillus alkalitolerans]|uniref:stage II sporulation protein P n=1 Tax=Paenibacillus alkalitolerans TaxID=2799335 RepID=UPI0018F54A6F|nr:stage II sporulation protein P [Paenibacillus alkalitolerans]